MILLIISLGVVHGVLLLPVLLTLLGPGGVFARSTQNKEWVPILMNRQDRNKRPFSGAKWGNLAARFVDNIKWRNTHALTWKPTVQGVW
jgi:hypothetical protein